MIIYLNHFLILSQKWLIYERASHCHTSFPFREMQKMFYKLEDSTHEMTKTTWAITSGSVTFDMKQCTCINMHYYSRLYSNRNAHTTSGIENTNCGLLWYFYFIVPLILQIRNLLEFNTAATVFGFWVYLWNIWHTALCAIWKKMQNFPLVVSTVI